LFSFLVSLLVKPVQRAICRIRAIKLVPDMLNSFILAALAFKHNPFPGEFWGHNTYLDMTPTIPPVALLVISIPHRIGGCKVGALQWGTLVFPVGSLTLAPREEKNHSIG
jgi:hypothetical protein